MNEDTIDYTQAGPTTITRRLYREVGVHNGPTIDPVALRAGVVGDGWLPGTAKAMAHLLQQGTPREAAITAQRVGRLPYSRSSFERTGHRVGDLYLQRRLEIEDELAELLVVPNDAKSVSYTSVSKSPDYRRQTRRWCGGDETSTRRDRRGRCR